MSVVKTILDSRHLFFKLKKKKKRTNNVFRYLCKLATTWRCSPNERPIFDDLFVTQNKKTKEEEMMPGRPRRISVMFPVERKRKSRKKSPVWSPSMVRGLSGKFAVP